MSRNLGRSRRPVGSWATIRGIGSIREDVGKKPLDKLARRLDQEAEGVAGAIRECMDDMLTCARLGLPDDLRRSLASTNQIGRVRQPCKNVRRRRDVRMVKRWTVSAVIETKKGMHRLRGYRSLPILEAALRRHQQDILAEIDQKAKAA